MLESVTDSLIIGIFISNKSSNLISTKIVYSEPEHCFKELFWLSSQQTIKYL